MNWLVPVAAIAASAYSLHSGWYTAAGWFGILAFLALGTVARA